MFYSIVITAVKKEDVEIKYPGLDLSLFIQRDPSGNLKYLEWEAKVLQSGKALAPEICDVIDLFNKYKDNLERKDINQYKVEEFTDLRDKLFEINENRLNKKNKYHVNTEAVACGTKVVYDSENFIVRLITNKDSSVHHGLGTKWCITMKDQTYFEDYDSNNVVFFFINCKKLGKDNNFYKLAFVCQRDKNNNIIQTEYFDALDNPYNNLDSIPFSEDELRSNDQMDGNYYKELNNIETKLIQIAKQQPKSILAKISSGEGTEDDFRKVYQITKNIKEVDMEEKYIKIMFEQPNVPVDILKDAAENGWLAEVADYKYCPPEMLQSLLKTAPNNQIKEKLINNDNLPLETLFYYLDDKNYSNDYDYEMKSAANLSLVRKCIDGSADDLNKIYNWFKENPDYGHPGILSYVINNENCSSELLDNMANEHNDEFGIIAKIIDHPNVSPETLSKIHQIKILK